VKISFSRVVKYKVFIAAEQPNQLLQGRLLIRVLAHCMGNPNMVRLQVIAAK